jgi:chaperonin GroEL
MLTRELQFNQEAKDSLLVGSQIVRDAVGATLGPRGNNVAFERAYGVTAVVHDGVTVAKQIELEDPFANMGVTLLREAAQETNNVAGDGTTTAIVLAHAILQEGHKLVAAGHNPMILRRGIQKAVTAIDRRLTEIAMPVKTDKDKESIATISAQDELIGKAIAAAIEQVGNDGVITVDESGTDLMIDIKEGMQFDRGLIHPLWVTDHQRMECVLNDVAIFVTDYVISEVAQIEKMMENVVGQHKQGNVLLIAKDVTGSALQFLALNKNENGFNLVPVKAPGIGDDQADYLQDIATLVGGAFISQASGFRMNDVTINQLGKAKRVTIGRDSTIIVDGEGPEEDVNTRVASIDKQLARTDLDGYQRERLRERKSKLTNGVAVIHVGGRSEAEIKERKERVIDAIGATKAAIDEGTVPGGETALLRARDALRELLDGSEQSHGVEIVYRAVEAPFRLLVENAGEDAGTRLNQVLAGDKGFDVMKLEIVDLVEEGIIDPVKVTRNALANAATAATSILTTSVLIALKREAKDGQAS